MKSLRLEDRQTCRMCGKSLPHEAFLREGRFHSTCNLCNEVPEVAQKIAKEINHKRKLRKKLSSIAHQASIERADVIKLHGEILDKFGGVSGVAQELWDLYQTAKDVEDVRTQHAILKDVMALSTQVHKMVTEELKDVEGISPEEVETLLRSVLGHGREHAPALEDFEGGEGDNGDGTELLPSDAPAG